MSELGDRIRSTFEEIAPPIDVERIAVRPRTETVASGRRGWFVAVAAAAVVLVAGVGSVLLFGGGNDGESANTTIGTTTTVTSSPDTTTSSIVGQSALDGAIATWVNQTGIPQMDRELWTARLDRACAEGVWNDEVAYRLAAEFVVADVGDGVAPAAGEAAPALWLMAVNYCRDQFPAGEVEDGPPAPAADPDVIPVGELSIVSIDCSTELPAFPCVALIDGDPGTVWNAPEGGVAAEMTIALAEPAQITGLILVNLDDPERFYRNSRIRTFEISVGDADPIAVASIDDAPGPQGVPIEGLVVTDTLTIRLTAAYPGQRFEDREPFRELVLAEVVVVGRRNGTQGDGSTTNAPHDLVRVDDGPLASMLLDDLAGFVADGATVTDVYDLADPQVPAFRSANVWLRLPDGTRLGVINQQIAAETAADLRAQMFTDADTQPGWPPGVRVVRTGTADWGQVSALWDDRLLHVRWELGPIGTDRGAGLTDTELDAIARVITTALMRSDVEVASGWELESGDLLVADGTGVRQVRDGDVIGTLYSGPAGAAFADGSGGVVVAAADRAMLDPWGGDAEQLLRIRPDGSSVVVLGEGATLWDVADVGLLGASVVYSQYLQEGDQVPDHFQDVLFVLPLDGSADPVRVARPVGSFEGGIFGVAWQPDQERFLISMGAEGDEWMSAWSLEVEELSWPANPAPQDGEPGARVWAMTGIPGTSRIAYIESAEPKNEPSYLVIYDTITGVEVSRAEVATDAWVSGLHANPSAVAVSRVGLDQIDGHAQYAYRPVIVYDLTSGALTELDVTGTASVTGP